MQILPNGIFTWPRPKAVARRLHDERLLMECADCFTGGGRLQGCTAQKEKHHDINDQTGFCC